MTETLAPPAHGSSGFPASDAAPAVPIGDAEFAALLERFSPFETRPHLAIAVSGGADSLALALLADRWTRARAGRITALTVDHGLRPESAEEAALVGRWLDARGIAHRVLRWEGPKPRTGIQAAARDARREHLLGWCRRAGVLHLLLAHHRDDQAETVLLRLSRGSGPDGLAAMAPVVELPELRLLRPFLDVPAARLKATLRASGQPWIEDPSNRNAAFTRTRMRRLLSERADVRADDLIAIARRFAAERCARERETAALLARSVTIYPEGWARVDAAVLKAAPPDPCRRALAATLLAVGGGRYAPRRERLDRLHDALRNGALGGGRTLAGCQISTRPYGLLVVREPRAATDRVALKGPGEVLWDGRFVITVDGRGPWPAGGQWLAKLGTDGWGAIAAAEPSLREARIPAAVRPGLPALWDLEGVLAVPHLLYRRRGADPDSLTVVSAMFRPRHALAGPGFTTI